MQLTFLILVFCSYTQHSRAIPPLHSESTWRRSRYIIDNRRNALFSKKPTTAFSLRSPSPEDLSTESANFRIGQEAFKQKLFPIERYHKDLTAEASISDPKFFRKYGENSLPRKIIKSYKITGGLSNHPEEYKYNVRIYENQKNSSFDNNNYFIQNDEVLNDVVTTTEKVLTWVPKEVLVSSTAASSDESDVPLSGEFEFHIPTTTSHPWEITKTEEGNQIDGANEKHVYETRIETVSYHQEVIFSPPKKQNWYREVNKPEPKNYEQPEENYEQPGENYEEPEKNFELDESTNVMSKGRIQQENGENHNKFGYVVEGANYRKYRVEERTSDGFIVGEYGVVSHDDGSLRGVRYTAESGTNPKLIYETLIKFLSL